MPAQYPIINGNAPSYSNVIISCNGKEYQGVKSISYGSELMPGEVRGTGPQRLARTKGDHKAEGSLEMFLQDAEAFLTDLGDGFGEVVFVITVVFALEDDSPLIERKLVGCRISKPSEDHSQGPDASTMKFDLDVNDVLYNGKSIVRNSLYK